MRFGSVEFFKVLIKTVLAILFFVPLILAVVFGVLFAQKNIRAGELEKENSVLQQDNARLSVVADVLVGEKIGGTEDIRDIMMRSGISYDDVIRLAVEKKEINAQGLYEILAKSGASDKDIISMAAAKKTVNAEDFYEIITKNGITAKDLIKAVVKNGNSSAEEYYAILSECGMTDKELIEFINNKKNGTASNVNSSAASNMSNTSDTSSGSSDVTSSGTSSEPNSSGSAANPYAALYPDMYVTAPASYNYEDGTIYFTFDDGPSVHTYDILRYLSQYNAKATWFVVPSRTDWCYSALKAISDAGHTIGVHSATHDYNKIYASVEAYLEDFYEAWSIVREATGQTPQVFRFPGGSKNDFNGDTRDDIIKEMTRRGFRFYDWNVESGDVDGATWQQMYNSLPRDCHAVKRPVILMHDRADTPNAAYVLEDVLKVLAGEGYKFDAIRNDTEPVQFIGPFS